MLMTYPLVPYPRRTQGRGTGTCARLIMEVRPMVFFHTSTLLVPSKPAIFLVSI
ncbi:hypothetical protein QR685DRAFT_519980 [Neurospora intermedia]|uniref:Uncharacterized protein n=1 Tax=Neurospora intermedia TaxID=5142 RepID=A0ABR3DGE5_NEUIN